MGYDLYDNDTQQARHSDIPHPGTPPLKVRIFRDRANIRGAADPLARRRSLEPTAKAPTMPGSDCLRSPQSKDGFKDEQEWRERSKLLHFSFDRAQYIREIQQEIVYADFNHPKNIELGPEWQEPQTFSTLSQMLAEGLASSQTGALQK